MRRIERTSRFKRDYRRELRGRHRETLASALREVVEALAMNRPLAEKHRDHALVGDWQDCRDCHVRPDLILIYRKPAPDVLQLIRLGSHSELGL